MKSKMDSGLPVDLGWNGGEYLRFGIICTHMFTASAFRTGGRTTVPRPDLRATLARPRSPV